MPSSTEALPFTTHLRLAAYALQRTAWQLKYSAPSFDAPPHDPVVVVLGMHRSGTSAAVGVLEDLGFTVPGAMSPEGLGDNKHGTREPVELISLSNRVLELNASSWSNPPSMPVRYHSRNISHRDRILRLCAGTRHVLKDPRMLLMLQMWEGVSMNPIAVVRNPIDVTESLLRRGEPATRVQCLTLWKHYNRSLLKYAQTHDCPIAFFDFPDFPAQVRRCLRHHGYVDSAATHFFDERLVRSRSKNWRQDVNDSEAVALYDALTCFAVDSGSGQAAGDSLARKHRLTKFL